MASIRTVGLTKHFGELRAANEIDLDLPEGGVEGFVGPNGAGKSATIRMLPDLIARPTVSDARTSDVQVDSHPQSAGMVRAGPRTIQVRRIWATGCLSTLITKFRDRETRVRVTP